MNHQHLAIIVVSGLAVLACGDSVGPRLNELDKARATWNRANTSQYEFGFVQHCGECPPGLGLPYHVRVFNNGSITMTNIQTGGEAPDNVERPTIPLLFSRIETTLRNDPAQFRAEYDRSLGYPRSVSVDINETAIDDEWGFIVSNLRAF
jgi:hypothetical protein